MTDNQKLKRVADMASACSFLTVQQMSSLRDWIMIVIGDEVSTQLGLIQSAIDNNRKLFNDIKELMKE